MKRKGSIGGTVGRWIFVLMIFGILAATLLTPTCAVATPQPAAASNVVSQLRGCKAAALMYLEDSAASPDIFPAPVPNANNFDRIRPYLDNSEKISSDHYMFYIVGEVWWVGYKLGQGTPPSESFWAGFFGSREKPWELNEGDRGRLEGKAKSAGLYGTSDATAPPASDDKTGLYKQEDPVIWMRVK